MKVRTEALLLDAIDSELIWRKKELTQLKFLVGSLGGREDRRIAVLRSAVPILYAHWEGFIKASGLAYVEYVASQQLRYEELAPPFLAMAARRIVNSATGSRKIRVHIELAEFFRRGLTAESKLPYKTAIDAESNLTSTVLRDIVDSLGLDFAPYELKAHLIDEGLLKARNEIAHGEYLLITEQRYEELGAEVLGMMETFRTQVQNAAVLKQFLVNP
jgi:hypothetical protein